MILIALALLTILPATLAPVSADTAPAGALPQGANAKCPVQTSEDVDSGISTMYEAQRVYFCCPKCRRKFLDHPAIYLANLPQFVSSPTPGAGASGGGISARGGAGLATPQRLVRWFGRFHPVVVHFPIALLLAALAADLMGWFLRNEDLSSASRYASIAGAAGAAVAAALGWAAWFYSVDPGELAWALSAHRWFGTATAILAALAALYAVSRPRSASPRRRVLQRALLVACAVMVAITGHLGSLLVFGEHPFAW